MLYRKLLSPRLNTIYENITQTYSPEAGDIADDDLALIQLLSPACIVARFKMNNEMSAAKLIRQVDDRNISRVLEKPSILRMMFTGRTKTMQHIEENLQEMRKDHKVHVEEEVLDKPLEGSDKVKGSDKVHQGVRLSRKAWGSMQHVDV